VTSRTSQLSGESQYEIIGKSRWVESGIGQITQLFEEINKQKFLKIHKKNILDMKHRSLRHSCFRNTKLAKFPRKVKAIRNF
jgi:hypothetical protein